MNIFILSFNPAQAAQALCDKHVPKMLLETAQLLCSPFEPGTAPYKRTHYNHPCAKWVRAKPDNYTWLLLYGEYIAKEYQMRFGREHKSAGVIEWCANNRGNFLFLEEKHFRGHDAKEQLRDICGNTWNGFCSPFVQAVPDKYKCNNPVAAYRAYYIGEKARFAKWERGRKPPRWWPRG